MKHLQIRSLALLLFALCSLIVMSNAAATATTLEIGGAAQTQAVTSKASVSGSLLFSDTFGSSLNTCKESTFEWATVSPFRAPRIGGNVSSLAFSECTEGAITVHASGYLEAEAIPGTTNAKIFSKNAQFTLPSPFGLLNCTTPPTGTAIGTLTGVSTGNARIDISATLNCGSLTAQLAGTYLITSPAGLGVITATTLEVSGIKQSSSVAVEATVSGSALLTDQYAIIGNTCKQGTVKGSTTTPFTATRVGGSVSTLSFSECTEGTPTVHSAGYLEVERTSGTNGKVFSKNAQVTVPSAFGLLNCTTPSTGTSIGTLTGVSTAKATLHISATLNCGSITGLWSGTYLVTSPEGLGVAE